MNSINKNFKYIYVIFMPNREKYIKEFFNRIKVNAIFIPAVNRDNLPPLSELLKDKIINKFFLFKHLEWEGYPEKSIEEFEQLTDPKIVSKLRGIKGAIGLQLSYLNVFRMFLENKDADKCLIFEDDLILPHNMNYSKLFFRFNEIFSKELKNVNWDIVNMGRCHDICSINTHFSKNLVYNSSPFCTHAVAYSKKIAEETILNSLPLSQTGDWLMAWFYYANPIYKCFSVKGRLFDQNETLGTMLDHVDKLPECKGQKVLKNKLKKL